MMKHLVSRLKLGLGPPAQHEKYRLECPLTETVNEVLSEWRIRPRRRQGLNSTRRPQSVVPSDSRSRPPFRPNFELFRFEHVNLFSESHL